MKKLSDINASELIEKVESYTLADFQEDFQSMIDSYQNLPPLGLNEVRDEISDWEFLIKKDMLHTFDAVCEAYAKFISYQNRVTQILDEVKRHDSLLEFIIDNVKSTYSQFIDGTVKDKESKSTTLLLDVTLMYTDTHTLMQYVQSVQKNIEFNTQQLARILREREALAKINNDYVKTGISSKFYSPEIKTKNRS